MKFSSSSKLDINYISHSCSMDLLLQEFYAHLQSVTNEMEGRWKSVLAKYMKKNDLQFDKLRAEMKELAAKMKADRESFRAEAEQMLDSLTAMKERMRKMAEEENATAKDRSVLKTLSSEFVFIL